MSKRRAIGPLDCWPEKRRIRSDLASGPAVQLPYFIVGITYSAPERTEVGQREVTVFKRV
jgi:hypothetical protein